MREKKYNEEVIDTLTDWINSHLESAIEHRRYR
nr:Multiple antibiotic resistance protein MarA [Candidatus Pantoea persica]